MNTSNAAPAKNAKPIGVEYRNTAEHTIKLIMKVVDDMNTLYIKGELNG